jgi:sugar/nucleoside kinase (ribokinase family)
MRTNYVLIDFENVQPSSLEALGHDHFKLLVFVGANQAKVPFETAASLQQLGARAGYVKITGNGSNALDFHIAYYIGKLAATEPTAYFHIVSKDTGFDSLIQHLKAEGIFVGRVKAISEIPLVKASAAKTPSERNQVAANRLQQMKAAKPRTVKTLSSTIASLFQKQLSEEEVAAIVHWLAEQGHLAIAGTKVSYTTHGDA